MSEYSITDGRILGAVLDVSLNEFQGKRTLDIVKNNLVKIVQNIMQGDDLFYLYHPSVIEPVDDIGMAVGAIANYETDGWLQNLRLALCQTYYVMAAEDLDLEKSLLFITDRIHESTELKKVVALEERDEIGCSFLFMGVGNGYDKDVLKEMERFESVGCFYVDDPNEISDHIL